MFGIVETEEITIFEEFQFLFLNRNREKVRFSYLPSDFTFEVDSIKMRGNDGDTGQNRSLKDSLFKHNFYGILHNNLINVQKASRED